MRVAFTHNLKRTESEEEAEFDTPETVARIAHALEAMGHEVELIDVGGPPSRAIARLEAYNPDLVFNTAEGRLGRFREGFFPGVFEQLGIPFTGSDAYVCTLTLDKNLTKRVIEAAGIPVPQARLFTAGVKPDSSGLTFPLMLKPNFEGSSKGITQESVVENVADFEKRLALLIKQYPNGILVEEYIEGKDVTVPYLEAISVETGGVLTPAEYVFDLKGDTSRKYKIYDYDLKNVNSDRVEVKVPAELTDEVRRKVMEYSRKAVAVLGVRDFGRIDYRVTPDGRIYFIEVNALPSLEEGAGIYLCALSAGLRDASEVIEAIVKSAVSRSPIELKRRKSRGFNSKRLRVGFTYNEKRITPGADPSTDLEAEFDAPKTLDAIRGAIRSFGHELVDLEAATDLPARLADSQVDVVFNISEGLRGRNREAQVPAILELLDIPYTGSDSTTLSLTLDKGVAKKIVRESGVQTPGFLVMVSGKEKVPKELHYPLIVKPIAEGSSKGVLEKSVVHNEAELRETARIMITKYRQPALAEEFLTGREFTVALLGEKRPRILPPMEIVFTKPGEKYPIYAYQHKLDVNPDIRYDAPAIIDDRLRDAIEKSAKKSFAALGCRDYARIDFRLDSQGRVNFIECNPLPGLTPKWSDFCIISEAAGYTYEQIISEILTPCIRRYKEKRKLLLQAEPHQKY